MAPASDSISTVLAKLEELSQKFDNMDHKTDETTQKIEEMQLSIRQLKDEQIFFNKLEARTGRPGLGST